MAHPRMNGFTLIEVATLISVVRLEDNAYGVAIREDIEGFLGQPVALASVYATLQDLTRRQVLTVTQSPPLAVQGGRAKRLYRLSASGRSLLQYEQLKFTRLFQALPRGFGRT